MGRVRERCVPRPTERCAGSASPYCGGSLRASSGRREAMALRGRGRRCALLGAHRRGIPSQRTRGLTWGWPVHSAARLGEGRRHRAKRIVVLAGTPPCPRRCPAAVTPGIGQAAVCSAPAEVFRAGFSISASRDNIFGLTCSIGQRMQACSCWHSLSKPGGRPPVLPRLRRPAAWSAFSGMTCRMPRFCR